MIWEDILVDRMLSEEELLLGISKMFGREKENIKIVNCIEAVLDAKKAPITCHPTVLGGQFPQKLSFYINDAVKPLDKFAAVKRFCTVVGIACLLSDESIDPYTMLYVCEDGSISSVNLDPTRLDELNEYRIDI